MTVVGVIIKSARDLWPVVALMLLMCFVFTVLGMQLFGATLDPGREEYATHPYAVKTRFDTFFWSFVQVCKKHVVGHISQVKQAERFGLTYCKIHISD